MVNAKKLFRLTQIQLKNFRCFNDVTVNLDAPVVLLEGQNGIGKTSLLEALYYACYLRSFRTHLSRDLISFGKYSFFVKVQLKDDQQLHNTIQVGFTGAERLVKINKKIVSSYKELMEHYRVVSLTEDDLELVKGGPRIRRSFIDQAILLSDPEFIHFVQDFRVVLENRNKLLQKESIHSMYDVWTQQLWEKSFAIQQKRKEMLVQLETEVNQLLDTYFDGDISITFSYVAKKKSDELFDTFFKNRNALKIEEMRYGRSLFGAHLDDFIIRLQDKRSKAFASRGQQKFIVLLIKTAQIKYLSAKRGPAIFLLDDFMTDFDPNRADTLLSVLIDLNNQLIFTSPTSGGNFECRIQACGGQITKLTI